VPTASRPAVRVCDAASSTRAVAIKRAAAGSGIQQGSEDVLMSLPPPAMLGELSRYPGFLSPDLRALASDDARSKRALEELRARVLRHEAESRTLLDQLTIYESVSGSVASVIERARGGVAGAEFRALNRGSVAAAAATEDDDSAQAAMTDRERVDFLVSESNRRLQTVADMLAADGARGAAVAQAAAPPAVVGAVAEIGAAVRTLVAENIDLRQRLNSISGWAFERTLERQEHLVDEMQRRAAAPPPPPDAKKKGKRGNAK
jgi:hypothetical protein